MANQIITNRQAVNNQATNNWLQQLKEFSQWHQSVAGNEKYYGNNYILQFADNKIELPFLADIFEAIDIALATIIEENE